MLSDNLCVWIYMIGQLLLLAMWFLAMLRRLQIRVPPPPPKPPVITVPSATARYTQS